MFSKARHTDIALDLSFEGIKWKHGYLKEAFMDFLSMK